MIYKFKSKAAGDLIMLEPQGRRLLDIIGKDAGPKGIITAAQLAAAIAALEAAVAQDEAQRQGAAAPDDDAAPPGADSVSLRQRTKPFLDMLRRCEAAQVDVVWGV